MFGLVYALGLSLVAPALPAGVDVQWTAAPGCPEAVEVERRIAERLEQRTGPVRASVVVAVVSGEDGAYRLALDVTLPDEVVHRELESTSCEVLADATVVVVGIAVEPQLSTDDVRTATLVQPAVVVVPPVAEVEVEETAPESPPRVEPEPPLAERAEPRARAQLGGLARLQGGGTAGLLPRVAGVAGVRLGFRGRRWRVELGGDRTFRVRDTFVGEPDVGARFTMWSGTVRGCFVPARGALEFPLCAGAEGGLIQARGFGADINRRLDEAWFGLVAAPGLVWRVHPNVGLAAGLDALVSLRPLAFDGEDRPVLHRTFPVAARLVGGVEFRWGG